MDIIGRFSGQYAFLSNFYDQAIEYNGHVFKTAEHAYQAQKTIDDVDFEKIKSAETPGIAKKMGGKICVRWDWDEVKVEIMFQIVLAKFSSDEVLKQNLLATYPSKIIEGNTWGDTFWGICNGIGENCLGQILMRVRDILGRDKS
jgi:ribA/ribD-fused uncharacterized protein